jgi:competence protein ComEA
MLHKISVFLGGLFTGLLATGLLILFISEPRGTPVVLHPPPTPGPVTVHVAGAVVNPGVYELPSGSIVSQAIEDAGGILDSAAVDWINLAETVSDGQQITVPLLQESEEQINVPGPESEIVTKDPININTATAPELERLPGIGPSLAQKIVDYRDENGPFQKAEHILRVSGIGPSKFEQIQDLICIR